ncbi:MAG: hypothetical protein R3C15_03510 [Thermoleophilia bacterium]
MSTRRDARRREAGDGRPSPARGADDLRAWQDRQARRERWLRLHAIAWAVGSAAIAALWAVGQWRSHGAFEHFGSHAGNPHDWNPTLLVLPIALWGLIVGVKGLRVALERPPTAAAVAVAVERSGSAAGPTARRAALADGSSAPAACASTSRRGRSMVVLTPIWALLEWQDNGGFARWSGEGRPGDWAPWILYVGAGWALAVLVVALSMRAGLADLVGRSDRRRRGPRDRPTAGPRSP